VKPSSWPTWLFLRVPYDDLVSWLSMLLVIFVNAVKKEGQFSDDLKISAWSFQSVYLDFSPFSRSFYVVDIDTSKQQRLSFSPQVGASLNIPAFSGTLVHE